MNIKKGIDLLPLVYGLSKTVDIRKKEEKENDSIIRPNRFISLEIYETTKTLANVPSKPISKCF